MVKTRNRQDINPRILIIEKDDIPTDSLHKFGFQRYEYVFIHSDNVYKERYKELITPTINVLGVEIGKLFYYGE